MNNIQTMPISYYLITRLLSVAVSIMRLVILDDYSSASEWAAKYVRNRIISFNPGPDRPFVLGLPTGKGGGTHPLLTTPTSSLTGSTPLGMYRKLIEFHKEGKLSFKHVVTFNMDEYVNLAEDHPESYHSYMWNNFFKHIDINPENVHILDGNASDLVEECDKFEQEILKVGGVELFIGGEIHSFTHSFIHS